MQALKKYSDGIMLLSNNPKYEPIVFSKQEIIDKPVKIIGKVVELRGKILKRHFKLNQLKI